MLNQGNASTSFLSSMLKLTRQHLFTCLPRQRWVQVKRTLLTQSYAQGPTSVCTRMDTFIHVHVEWRHAEQGNSHHSFNIPSQSILMRSYRSTALAQRRQNRSIYPVIAHSALISLDRTSVSSDLTIDSVVSRHQGQRLTYSELQAESNALAWGLRDVGVKKGDRVAVSMGNCLEYAIVRFLPLSTLP